MSSFWAERLAKKKAQLAEYDDALSGILSGGIQSYQLNTGQTQQLVTKVNARSLQEAIAQLESDIASLEARLCGAGIRVIPGF